MARGISGGSGFTTIRRHTNAATHAMTSAPNTPGADAPRYANSAPPSDGAITRVKLSTEADKPSMLPISSG